MLRLCYHEEVAIVVGKMFCFAFDLEEGASSRAAVRRR